MQQRDGGSHLTERRFPPRLSISARLPLALRRISLRGGAAKCQIGGNPCIAGAGYRIAGRSSRTPHPSQRFARSQTIMAATATATTAIDNIPSRSMPEAVAGTKRRAAATTATAAAPATSDSDFAHANRSSKLPKDLAGKPIPRSKHWGYDLTLLQPRAFVWKNLVNIVLIGGFTLFNSSAFGHAVYDDLTTRFGSFNLRFFGTWIITTSVLWGLSALYALADLTGRPKWLYKYKVQPFVRVKGTEYANIALGALRNLVVVATPLMLVGAWTIPTPTSSDQLPGPLRTVATVLFDGESFICHDSALFLCTANPKPSSLRSLFAWRQCSAPRSASFTSTVGSTRQPCMHVFTKSTTSTQLPWRWPLHTAP